jgi:hypothetical protein
MFNIPKSPNRRKHTHFGTYESECSRVLLDEEGRTLTSVLNLIAKDEEKIAI